MPLQPERTELIRSENLIGGQWLAAAGGERFAVTDPATGAVITCTSCRLGSFVRTKRS